MNDMIPGNERGINGHKLMPCCHKSIKLYTQLTRPGTTTRCRWCQVQIVVATNGQWSYFRAPVIPEAPAIRDLQLPEE